MVDCELRAANGHPGTACDEGRCVYWRAAAHLGLSEPDGGGGCAIQHFSLLDGGAEVAAWLLSVKERVEGNDALLRGRRPKAGEVIFAQVPDPRD